MHYAFLTLIAGRMVALRFSRRIEMAARSVVAAVLAIAVVQTQAVFAQGAATFPAKPITIVIPASPGGAIDLVARLTGQKMSGVFAKAVIVDNNAGATGIIGTEFVAHSAPARRTCRANSSRAWLASR
jgi:tripartite-type tricarboxylate transporter receptor subunit TctC